MKDLTTTTVRAPVSLRSDKEERQWEDCEPSLRRRALFLSTLRVRAEFGAHDSPNQIWETEDSRPVINQSGQKAHRLPANSLPTELLSSDRQAPKAKKRNPRPNRGIRDGPGKQKKACK